MGIPQACCVLPLHPRPRVLPVPIQYNPAMIPLFLGLTAVNLLCLALASVLGFTRPGSAHILAGAVAAMVCVGVHCVVFTYFIATAKWAQHAVLTRKLDAQLIPPTRSFKMQA